MHLPVVVVTPVSGSKCITVEESKNAELIARHPPGVIKLFLRSSAFSVGFFQRRSEGETSARLRDTYGEVAGDFQSEDSGGKVFILQKNT